MISTALARPALALLRLGLERAAARAHERELRGDEEPVQQNEHEHRQEQEDAHAMRGERRREGAPLLRERSSSFIRRRGSCYPTRAARERILLLMRIVSLVPSATEMLFALGLGDEVTAVTHECDHPPQALELPKVTRDVIGPGLEPAEIDRAVRELTEQGRAIYELDEAALRDLQPDLIVTQALCAVCAVSYDDVKAVAERLDPEPKVISLDPHTLGEMLGDVRVLAAATDSKDAGVDLVQDAATRIDRVRLAVRGARPVAVAALEWLDPVFVAGHWTPQLIEYAGGIDVLGLAGEHSETRSWEEVARGRARGRRRDAVRLRRRARARGGLRLPGRARRARRAAHRRRRRRRLLLAPRPAAGRRARAARAHPAPGPGAGAERAAGARGRPSRGRPSSRATK